ncbi:MAG: hypothetical protein JST82_13895 [Bacteroidetes bacterium]|nr:hypothetical protein [Bacteroidota bacterium]
MNSFQKIIIYFVSFSIVVVCIVQYLQLQKIKKEATSFKNSYHTVPFDSLKKNIATIGDIPSYEKLKLEYMDIDAIENLLPWALIMANKYGYKPAYFDVYTSIQGIDMYYGNTKSESSLEAVDSNSKKIALEYLIKASKIEDSQAIKILNEHYPSAR